MATIPDFDRKGCLAEQDGRTKAGTQRYRCNNCGCSYTPAKKAQDYSQARQKAIKIYVDGEGLRRTGSQLGIHHQTITNWAKKEPKKLPDAPIPQK